MKKRLTAILLTIVLMMGLTTFAAAEEGIPTAATFDELVAAMGNGATTVEITNTIVVDTDKVLGYDDSTISLTRSANFMGDVLLWVENATLKNLNIDGCAIETEKRAVWIFGDSQFENVIFSNCLAGAVEIRTGTATFSNCAFKDNNSDTGAHILNNATAVFSNCTFSGGTAEKSAGAVRNNADLTLTDCTFTGNSTNGVSTFQNGGAIYNTGTLYAENCGFIGNTSLVGGAIDSIGSSNMQLIACTLTNNSAKVGGGVSNSGTATIADTLIYKNIAIEEGTDLDSSVSISVSYSDSYIFDETPNGWYSDFYTERPGEKLFDLSFNGSGKLVFLMESDLPAKEPDPPAVDPTPTPTPEPEPERPTVRPSSSGGHHTTAVNKPIKPTLDKAKTLYLSGYCDAVPNENITRRQVAHILYNLMSAESQKHYASNENIFIDVEDDIAIAALAKAKIVLGYDEHYRPDAYLTRGELCAILSRFSDLKSGASSFQNIEHHWARDYVNICVSNGWIADGTEIDLNSYITVKDAANIIEKML